MGGWGFEETIFEGHEGEAEALWNIWTAKATQTVK